MRHEAPILPIPITIAPLPTNPSVSLARTMSWSLAQGGDNDVAAEDVAETVGRIIKKSPTTVRSRTSRIIGC
jgi:hypothetical protein